MAPGLLARLRRASRPAKRAGNVPAAASESARPAEESIAPSAAQPSMRASYADVDSGRKRRRSEGTGVAGCVRRVLRCIVPGLIGREARQPSGRVDIDCAGNDCGDIAEPCDDAYMTLNGENAAVSFAALHVDGMFEQLLAATTADAADELFAQVVSGMAVLDQLNRAHSDMHTALWGDHGAQNGSRVSLEEDDGLRSIGVHIARAPAYTLLASRTHGSSDFEVVPAQDDAGEDIELVSIDDDASGVNADDRTIELMPIVSAEEPRAAFRLHTGFEAYRETATPSLADISGSDSEWAENGGVLGLSALSGDHYDAQCSTGNLDIAYRDVPRSASDFVLCDPCPVYSLPPTSTEGTDAIDRSPSVASLQELIAALEAGAALTDAL